LDAWPAGQGEHEVCDVSDWNSPMLHSVQAVAPVAAMKLPTGHSRQLTRPVVLEKSPLPQSVQVPRPSTGWLVPMGQGVQRSRPVTAATEPGGHRSQALVRLTLGLKLPMAHGRQSDRPNWSAYVPFGQMLHDVDPGKDATEPGGHAAHTSEQAPEVKVPRAQDTQDNRPVLFVALPGSHGVHSAWPV